MWGKRQRADDWDDDRGDQSEDPRDQRPDDRRGGGFWDESAEWAGNNGGRHGAGGQNPGGQNFANGSRPGHGDDGRQGFGDPSRAQQRRGRADFGDGPFGSEGGPVGEPGFGDSSYGGPGYIEPGFGGSRQERQERQERQDAWQGDPRRPVRDFPDGGFGQPGYGGRGGDFGAPNGGGPDFGGDFRGGDRREPDRRDPDRRESYGPRSDGGGPRNDGGGWGQIEAEMPAPAFTPAGQDLAPAPGGFVANVGGNRPYGRLSIFTLLDDRVAEFDRLAGQAAEGVRVHEPDTLVYVMHVVPKAPMQRIIYEIYRDHAAFEDHQRQPHILEFEEGRRSCVLVTNIIDLRLKYAKVAPLQGAAPQPSGPRQITAGPPQPGPGARHRGPSPLDSDNGTWFGGDAAGGRPADQDGDWAGDRSFNSGERRSQDWGQPQYMGQRYRDN